MYQVHKDGKPIGKPFTVKQQAEDYAKSIGGTVQPAPATQRRDTRQQKLTQ